MKVCVHSFTQEDDEILLNYMEGKRKDKYIKKISVLLGKDVSCTELRYSELVDDSGW